MGAMASQITSLTFIYSTVYPGADQRKHQSSPSLAFVRGNHRWLMTSPHKEQVTRKMFLFDDVIMFFTIDATWGSFYWHGLTLFPAWIINHMPSKVWNEITHLFPNFNGAVVGVWEWISNFIIHFMMDVITYPYTYHPWEAMGLRLLTIHDIPAVGVHQRFATWMHVRR